MPGSRKSSAPDEFMSMTLRSVCGVPPAHEAPSVPVTDGIRSWAARRSKSAASARNRRVLAAISAAKV